MIEPDKPDDYKWLLLLGMVIFSALLALGVELAGIRP